MQLALPRKERNVLILIKLFMRKYGNTAFGLVSVIILWFAIVQPNMKADRQASIQVSQQNAETARALAGISSNVNQAADSIARAAEANRIVAEKLTYVLGIAEQRSFMTYPSPLKEGSNKP